MTTPEMGPRGAAFLAHIEATFDASEIERELVIEAARCLDEIEGLSEAISRDGVTVEGSRGQVRPHPALSHLREHRVALARLLGSLNFPADDIPQTPAQGRARKAAEARWQTHTKRGSA